MDPVEANPEQTHQTHSDPDERQNLESRLEEARTERETLDLEIARLERALGQGTAVVPRSGSPSMVMAVDDDGPIPFGRLGPPQPPEEFFFADDALPSVDVGNIARMTPEELDRLPFGVVTLDNLGRVINYSDTESRLAGLPKSQVIGKYFFEEVAPCARVQEFQGRFRDLVAGRSRLGVEVFDFVFRFARGIERVTIMIAPARVRGRFNICMVRKKGSAAPGER